MNASQRDELLIRLDERSEAAAKKLDEHNGDIRALKAWQTRLTGAFGLLAFVVLYFQTDIREAVTRVFGS